MSHVSGDVERRRGGDVERRTYANSSEAKEERQHSTQHKHNYMYGACVYE